MENTTNNQPEVNPSPENSNATNINGIWNSIKQFLNELLDIRKDTDKKATIEDIKGNISMKGHTAWVLVFSILIASIGLSFLLFQM